MSDSEEIPSRIIQEAKAPKWNRLAELVFGGIAKGTMVVVAIAFFLFSFPESITNLPTTKKELLIVLLMAIFGIAGAIILFYFGFR